MWSHRGTDLDSWKHSGLLPWVYPAPLAQNQLLHPSLTVSSEQLRWQPHGSSCKDGECRWHCRSALKCFLPFRQHPIAVSKMYELPIDFCAREQSSPAPLTQWPPRQLVCACTVLAHRGNKNTDAGFAPGDLDCRLTACTALHDAQKSRQSPQSYRCMFYSSTRYEADTVILFRYTYLTRLPPNSSKDHLEPRKKSKENQIDQICCLEESLGTLHIFL